LCMRKRSRQRTGNQDPLQRFHLNLSGCFDDCLAVVKL
jgi:hypothetical protein